jgi:hypothetical protein
MLIFFCSRLRVRELKKEVKEEGDEGAEAEVSWESLEDMVRESGGVDVFMISAVTQAALNVSGRVADRPIVRGRRGR